MRNSDREKRAARAVSLEIEPDKLISKRRDVLLRGAVYLLPSDERRYHWNKRCAAGTAMLRTNNHRSFHQG
jgi:hypothetical protein